MRVQYQIKTINNENRSFKAVISKATLPNGEAVDAVVDCFLFKKDPRVIDEEIARIIKHHGNAGR